MCLMVKDEEGQLYETLESINPYINIICVLDTGSTDNTVRELEQWCSLNEKLLHLKTSNFVDFSTSRNMLLEFAGEKAEWFLLMDAGDVLCGDWPSFERQIFSGLSGGYYIQQLWRTFDSSLKYYNIRCIKAGVGWSFKGVVHECLDGGNLPVERTNYITIFQDRAKYGSKSAERFKTDLNLLGEQVAKNPMDTRACFYLAQTYISLGMDEKGFEYYKRRAKMSGFHEEVFVSYLECAKCQLRLGNKKKAIAYFLRAVAQDLRVEPLLGLADLYREEHRWSEAFIFLDIATRLDAPADRWLFMDDRAYQYRRWHLMGIVAYYCEKYKIGEMACTRAITASKTAEERALNERNLAFYQRAKQT